MDLNHLVFINNTSGQEEGVIKLVEAYSRHLFLVSYVIGLIIYFISGCLEFAWVRQCWTQQLDCAA